MLFSDIDVFPRVVTVWVRELNDTFCASTDSVENTKDIRVYEKNDESFRNSEYRCSSQ